MAPVIPLVPTAVPQGAPPVVPPGPASSRVQLAARASWIAPLLVYVLGLVIKSAGARDTEYGVLIIGIISFLLYCAGFVVAVYALSRPRIAGWRGVFAPALVGLILNGLLLLLLGSNFVLSLHLLG